MKVKQYFSTFMENMFYLKNFLWEEIDKKKIILDIVEWINKNFISNILDSKEIASHNLRDLNLIKKI